MQELVSVKPLPFTEEQRQLIIRINRRANEILFQEGGTETDLLEYLKTILNEDLRQILKLSSSEEMHDALCEPYDGFYLILILFEQYASCASRGFLLEEIDEICG